MIGTERIDLLPEFVGVRRRTRKLLATAALTAVGIGVGAGFAYVGQVAEVSRIETQLQQQRAANAALSAEVAELASVGALSSTVSAKTALLSSLTEDEVRWSILLADIQAVLPNDTWLTGFTGTLGGIASGLGRLEFQGATFSHPDVANWLDKLATVPGFTEPYISVSSKADIDGKRIVQFSSSVVLTEVALRRATPGAERRP